MGNSLKKFLSSYLFGGKQVEMGKSLQCKVDSLGLLFFAEPSVINDLHQGNGDPSALMQIVVLQMLHEQGDAEKFPNGYRLGSNVVAGLDDEQEEILQLQGRFQGKFASHISGHSKKAAFNITLSVLIEGNEYPFSRKGPYLFLGGDEKYRLSPPELMALEALEFHQALNPSDRNEADNLQLMARLQTAERSGMNIDLSHFQKLDVVVPEDIGVVATKLPDGSLELCPSLGDGSTPDQLNKRWGQIDCNNEGGVMRIDNRVVLLEQPKMHAIREVIGNKRIPADKVEEFIKTPSAFIDASLVNLDLGFSLRVLGVGKLQHMDFGQLTDEKRDWFAEEGKALPPQALGQHLHCQEDIEEFTQKMRAAHQQGADSVEFDGKQFDISSPIEISEELEKITAKIKTQDKCDTEPRETKEKKEQVTFLLKDADHLNQSLIGKIENGSHEIDVDWDNLSRTPYPHQKEGITWMLNLLYESLKDDTSDMYRVQGALLADDMGLGKTYMALVSLSEYLNYQRRNAAIQKPMLVVAPLSLLENWEQEIEQTFKESPFRDVVVLQSGSDLKKYRVKGAQRESAQLTSAIDENNQVDESVIRYALQIGKDAGTNRLDMDRRLVMTTYQTLRDYQFSLCVIDWGVVVFDEVQNIKNPNTLQTKAAKGLKADFKLLATGTPVENSLLDFWCLMDTAQPGLLGAWQQFREKWIKPIEKAPEEDRNRVREQTGAGLRNAVGGYMLRRIKEDQLKGLPKKIIRSGLSPSDDQIENTPELAVTMQGSQLLAYDEILDSYRKRRASEDMRGQALSVLNELRKTLLHPRLSENSELLAQSAKEARSVMSESAKLKILLNQLDTIRSKGEKVILFMISKQLQRILKLWLDQIYCLNVHIVNGDTLAVQKKKDSLTRKKMIVAFESVEGFNIIIMSPVAAGVGLTVVEANHVIHLERHWNPAKEAQATDRVYRIGQKKDVYIHLPAALHPKHNSFDVHLDRLLNSKMMLKEAVVTPEVVSENDIIDALGL